VDFRRSYTYEETAQIVRKSLAFFGDEYEKMVNNFLVSGNIDVYPVPGKISGAFSLNVPEVHPFLLLNFSGTRGNVFTLAHETGHAIHSAFADKTQPPASRAYPVFVAEVASIVNEFVLLDYMVKNAQSSEEKIDLLNQEINNLFGKFYRTAQLSEFEYKAYKRIENNLPVDIESLSSVFDSIEYKYYGKELCREPDEKYGWFRTQHLYNKYFYLFQYATSYSAALSIYKGISEEKDKEKRQELIEKYLNLLKAGGKDYPVDLLKLAGIDLTARKPYEDVVAYLKTLVDKLEWELKQAGKI